ncbi:hypothetical protein AA0112_g7086 [Alternaria arborescens]|uniref:hypothetical protein n=1 Tax=Alternaria arborescens TaxID=156630 RepID=UPI001074DF80|nr:hypothetical protein AA0111_g10106 [Alternaria arborescens]RYN29788.1 hypothetical protein AA0112_g7086 [Alternaria arborescens]RYO20435.1 hypothetical protein AA0111_g10106 [Alternaria arborescens]
MALMLAPYNSAMRLGMGFNSYTQTLCVNDVVRKPGNIPATDGDLRAKVLTEKTDAVGRPRQLTVGGESNSPQAVLEGSSGSMSRSFADGQKEVSQVVSWTAEFVNDSSEVLDKLDVSGALTIKMASLGKLSGHASFVDSTEMKKADVNYFIHVRVTNQRLVADNVTEFCPIDHIDPGQFTEIYGDCFISGFIEGGEFDAVISVTTADTIKKWNLNGGLELEAKISGIDVAGKVEGGKTDDKTFKNAKTTISVKWSGGGDIRDDKITNWDLESLKKVAMIFPDAVAACNAILTKYTSLRSYHEQTRKGSPLDYENAGVYTASLYDAYTSYKMMWKDIQTMLDRLNKNNIVLYMQKESDGLKRFTARYLGTEKPKESDAKNEQSSTALSIVSNTEKTVQPVGKKVPANKLELYFPDVYGLEIAATDCRFEMIKIVREVDAVTKDPKVACDPERVSQFLSPNIFRLLLPTADPESPPTMEKWKSTTAELKKNQEELEKKNDEIEMIKKKLESALITPEKAQNEDLSANAAGDVSQLHPRVQSSLSQYAYQAGDYRMQNVSRDHDIISTGAAFFNDLEHLTPGMRPTELQLWCNDQALQGICIKYGQKIEKSNGKRDGNPQHVLQLQFDEVITELEVYVARTPAHKLSVTGLTVATSKCNIMTAGVKSGGKKHSFAMADHSQWSFRGFFGFTFADGFEDLGVIWGKDISPEQTNAVPRAPTNNLLKMGPSLQEKTKKVMSETKPTESFYLGDCVSTGIASSTVTTFSSLDTISAASKINKISFCRSSGSLSGLKVDYTDGKNATHGAYDEKLEPWSCEVKAPIVAAKLSVSKTISKPNPFLDTVELVCGEANGGLPIWPLDVVTIRCLGDHSVEDQMEVVSVLAEQAPKLGRANWTLRGFYGEQSGEVITRLGLIWGSS